MISPVPGEASTPRPPRPCDAGRPEIETPTPDGVIPGTFRARSRNDAVHSDVLGAAVTQPQVAVGKHTVMSFPERIVGAITGLRKFCTAVSMVPMLRI